LLLVHLSENSLRFFEDGLKFCQELELLLRTLRFSHLLRNREIFVLQLAEFPVRHNRILHQTLKERAKEPWFRRQAMSSPALRNDQLRRRVSQVLKTFVHVPVARDQRAPTVLDVGQRTKAIVLQLEKPGPDRRRVKRLGQLGWCRLMEADLQKVRASIQT
jgi:hypothetical protein